MKKKNLLVLTILCVLSLCLFTGLIFYAFHLQTKRDLQNKNTVIDTPVPTHAAEVSDTSDDSQNITKVAAAEDTTDNSQSTATTEPTPTMGTSEADVNNDRPIILTFAGDVNLDESSYPAKKYDSEGKVITKCLSSDILKEMRGADIMMLNNEFAYSTRGYKTADKSYTFRADPSRVDILKEMGVDIVSLANNHALDYGPDALEDTFTTLDGAGIDYVGAGDDLARAKAPVYFNIDGKKIAFVAASRVVFATSWYATQDKLGMVGTYDPSILLQSIRDAKANSDYVVVFVHWGVERNNFPEEYQRSLAAQYIDAGADAVIGCHPHVVQGLEFYKDKPIAYSLGNFWFNNSTRDSAMLKLYLDPDGAVKVQLLPAMDKDTFTYLLKGKEKSDYYDFMQSLSFNTAIDNDGYVTETTEQ